MADSTQMLAIPKTVQDGLDELTRSLVKELGGALVSVALYGDLAKGEGFQPGHGVVNVAIVLDSVSLSKLDKAAPAIKRAIDSIRLAPLILSEDDLKTSTDVFPIKFLDMQKHHRVLHGKDVLSGLSIARDHLRLHCEQQVKNLHLRLNASYVRHATDASALRSTLESGVVSFIADLRTMLVLKTRSAPTLNADIVESATESLGLSADVINELLWLRRSEDRVPLAELKSLYSAFIDVVQHAASVIDKM